MKICLKIRDWCTKAILKLKMSRVRLHSNTGYAFTPTIASCVDPPVGLGQSENVVPTKHGMLYLVLSILGTDCSIRGGSRIFWKGGAEL